LLAVFFPLAKSSFYKLEVFVCIIVKNKSMALQPWRTGVVIKIADETKDTRRFWIQVPELTSFDFIPGQFVTLDLPIHEKVNKRWRSYSIASWPDGTNIFELIIVLDQRGAGTPYLFNEVSVGSTLSFRGPQGVFNLREPIENDVLLICTGTGIAPFRSMVHHLHLQNTPRKNVYLVFGCRTKGDLLYYEEMKELEKTMEGFKFLPSLSRERSDDCHAGYVHLVYESICADMRPASFYLCGWKGMIDEAKKRIMDMGYDKKVIHTEIYG
jgi:glycine betaine catabolism B